MKRLLISSLASLTLAIASVGLAGCQSISDRNTALESPSPSTDSCPQYSSNAEGGVTSVLSDTLNSSQIVRGQKLYVPFYSQIYQPEGTSRLNLSGTLSIRNTSETHNIRIIAVRYFDTSGKLVKKCLEGKHLVLSPMATTEFGISREDETGGSGANFIVEWVSETPVSDPVVEAIMVTASGTQGYTFLTSGRVIEEFRPDSNDR